MIIKKTKTDLTILLEDEKNIFDIIQSEDLFRNDIYFYHSNVDGWQYFYDANRNKVVWLTDYGFNEIERMLKERKITLPYVENGEDYIGYEWNER